MRFAVASQRFLTTACHVPVSRSKTADAHAAAVGANAVVVVVLLDNIRGLPRELVWMERPIPRSIVSTLPTVSTHNHAFSFTLFEPLPL